MRPRKAGGSGAADQEDDHRGEADDEGRGRRRGRPRRRQAGGRRRPEPPQVDRGDGVGAGLHEELCAPVGEAQAHRHHIAMPHAGQVNAVGGAGAGVERVHERAVLAALIQRVGPAAAGGLHPAGGDPVHAPLARRPVGDHAREQTLGAQVVCAHRVAGDLARRRVPGQVERLAVGREGVERKDAGEREAGPHAQIARREDDEFGVAGEAGAFQGARTRLELRAGSCSVLPS